MGATNFHTPDVCARVNDAPLKRLLMTSATNAPDRSDEHASASQHRPSSTRDTWTAVPARGTTEENLLTNTLEQTKSNPLT